MGYMYALSWKLLIIELLKEYFATLLKRLHLKKNNLKMFHMSSQNVLFSYGKVKDVFWVRIKFHLGRAKRRGERRYGERVIFAKFPLLSKIQTLSNKLLVRQTSNHHHCNQYAQKFKLEDFQVILSSSSWSQTNLCILRNKYGH